MLLCSSFIFRFLLISPNANWENLFEKLQRTRSAAICHRREMLNMQMEKKYLEKNYFLWHQEVKRVRSAMLVRAGTLLQIIYCCFERIWVEFRKVHLRPKKDRDVRNTNMMITCTIDLLVLDFVILKDLTPWMIESAILTHRLWWMRSAFVVGLRYGYLLIYHTRNASCKRERILLLLPLSSIRFLKAHTDSSLFYLSNSLCLSLSLLYLWNYILKLSIWVSFFSPYISLPSLQPANQLRWFVFIRKTTSARCMNASTVDQSLSSPFKPSFLFLIISSPSGSGNSIHLAFHPTTFFFSLSLLSK